MTLEEAQTLWRNTRPENRANDAIVREVKSTARRFKLQILVRDSMELLASLAVACSFVYAALQPGASRAAYLTAAGLAVLPVLFLGAHRIVTHEAGSPSMTMREHVAQAHRTVLRQLWLLKRVFWWYLLPLGLSVGVFQVGTIASAPGSLVAKVVSFIIGAAVCAGVGWFVWSINRLAIRTRLEPLACSLREMSASLAEE